MSQRPMVSVVIPAYNGAAYLGAAIESVLQQTYKDWELIVVDDGSTDETAQVVGRYEGYLRYRVQENRGVAAARNLGLREARGKLVAFLDQDDFFLPQKLAVQVAAWQERPQLGMVHSGWQIVDEAGGCRAEVVPRRGIPVLDLAAWLLWKPVFLGAMLFRRDWLLRLGGFDTGLSQTPDVDLVLRLAVLGCEAAWVEPLTVAYRQHGGNASRAVAVQVRECAVVLERVLGLPNLPQAVRGYADRARYNHWVWGAWRFYHMGQLGEMVACLRRSLGYWSGCRTEAVVDWLGCLERYQGEYGAVLDVEGLLACGEWQELMWGG